MFSIARTRPAEAFWKRQHGKTWLADYAASIKEPYRQHLLAALQTVAPFGSVVDLGCNCGVLMPMFIATSPHVTVTGIDVSTEAIAEAEAKYPDHTWILGSVVDVLKSVKTADVVVSSSCCEHIDPTDIGQTIEAMARVATKAIVLQEVAITQWCPEGRSPLGIPEWRHNYDQMLSECGWTRRQRTWHDLTSSRPGAVSLYQPTSKEKLT